MRRALKTAAILVALAVALIVLPGAALAAPSGSGAGTSDAPTSTSDRVVIVLAPYFDWPDLNETSTPTLMRLAQTGALGAVNSRSRSRDAGEKGSPTEGALSISAGAWAVQEPLAAAAYGVNERYEVGTAAEAFRRTTGDQVGDNKIVFLGMPMTQRTNDERAYEVVLGTLGQAVLDADGTTAAIGNSDVGYVTGEQRRVRPAALAAMSSSGLVPLGEVSPKLLEEDAHAPFGIETDLKSFERALKQVRADLPAEKPGLVVLDAGDTYRAMRFRSQVTDEIHAEQREHALSTLDETVRLATEYFGDATIMVVSQSTGDSSQGDREGLGPIIVNGRGFEGYLTSNSTQRTGIVTNLDVTATTLSVLGLEQPVQVLGNPMHSVPSKGPAASRVAHLSSLGTTAIAVDEAKPSVVNTFVALTVVVLVLTAFVLVRASHWSEVALVWWVRGLKAALLLLLAVPMSSWLMFSWMPLPTSATQAMLGLIATTLGVWAIALLLWSRTPMRVPVAVLSLATVGTVLVDQWLGAPASFTNFFGYSPLLAARFYGIGNEAAAIVFGAAVVGAALLFDEWPSSRGVELGKRFGLPVLGLLVVFTAAAPFLGANIGVAIWGVVGFGLAWVLMNGHHVSWRLVFWLFLGVVVVIAAFAAVDLVGGGQQTHLGRALVSAEQGGLGELWAIVARKAETNVRVLTHTNWAYILVATLAFLALMRWRPQGGFADTLNANPHFADAITVSLVAGLVAYFTEDSGIVIPALEVFFVGVALSWLTLSALVGRAAHTGTPGSSDAPEDSSR